VLGIGRSRGRSGSAVHSLGWAGESGVPAGEVADQVVVEDSGPDLQEQVGTAGDHRICCFLTMRRLMTWLTVASAVAVEIGSPQRWRSP
jgi:hypothetical protein